MFPSPPYSCLLQFMYSASTNWPKPICRLVKVSGALKAAKTQVFWIEFGAGTSQIWKLLLKEPPPLSRSRFRPQGSDHCAMLAPSDWESIAVSLLFIIDMMYIHYILLQLVQNASN